VGSVKVHVAQSLASSAAVYPFIGENIIPFGCAVVLIDLDHVIENAIDTKNINPKSIFVYYDILLKNIDKDYFGII